ncbi:MAG: glycosyltransferase family 4 protein [Bacteroidia bacterium]|nr:glycosyltransferase family 4 protein [Bacteroidia bacterium]MBP9688329.1 glycosyltransferase family 4 protein [Bacteroidia bacterium]
MKLAFWISGLKDPSPRFRFLQFIEPLREKGHLVDVFVLNPSRNSVLKSKSFALQIIEQRIQLIKRLWQLLTFILFKAKQYDIIYTNKDLLPNLNIKWVEKLMSKFNSKLVFDIDDAIYLGARGDKLKAIMPYYKAVIAGSTVLQSYIENNYGVKCYYIPMAINTNNYKPAAIRPNGILRIGWSGSHHTNVYALPLLKEPLMNLAQKLDFEFIVISNKNPEINWEGVKTRFIEWTEDTEVAGLQHFDIGMMPLKDEPFERGKCALKAVQYMAIGIPALVSPVGVNSFIVRDGVDGLHCNTIQDFSDKLLLLAQNINLQKEMGKNALQRVHDSFSVTVLTNEYERVFKEIANS